MVERQQDGTYTVPLREECPVELKPWQTIHNITPMEDGTEVKTAVLDAPPASSVTMEMHPLRSTFSLLPYNLYLKAGKCQEINYWDSNTKFCGCCGSPMKKNSDISKLCTGCGKEIWPQLATAVIVLIHKGEEVLMVRARNFRGDYYGLVAGFVETGETLEEAVAREVEEEVGLKITNIRYFGSQPWPYPCGLMVGYEADYESGEIHVQLSELKNAAWFRRDNIPAIPGKMSIARQLIDSWLER